MEEENQKVGSQIEGSSVTSTPNATTPQNISPRKKSKLLYLFLALFILVILTFGAAAAVYVYKSSSPKPTPPLSLRANPTPDTTANWKTYANTKYEFSIQYPSNLQTYDNPNQFIDLQQHGIDLIEPGSNNNGFITEASILIYADTLKPGDKTTDKLGCSNFQQVGTVPVGAVQGTEYVTNCQTEVTSVLLQKGNTIYTFSINPKPNGSYASQLINKNTFTQILSTFKFTN